MSRNHKKIYINLAALTLFIIFMAVIMLTIRSAVPTWAYAVMVITIGVLIAVFAYRTIVWCARLKDSAENGEDAL